MKVKRNGKVIYLKDESEVESGDEVVTEEPTPEPAADPVTDPATEPGSEPAVEPGEDAKSMQEFEKRLYAKIEKSIKDIQEHPVHDSPVYRKETPTLEVSVIETDSYLRSKRPFVKLSGKMEKFVDYLKATAKNNAMGISKALQEDDDTDGGFTVPEDFQAEVIRYMDEVAVIRGRARVFNMTRDRLRLPTLDQSSSVFGGFTINQVEEEAAATEDSPSWGTLTLNAKKVVGLTYISSELLEDSAINIANFMVSLFGESLADHEDSKFLTGTGMVEPLGITIASGVNVVTRAASTRITYVDIVNMYKNTLSQFDRNAVWITNKAGVAQLMLANQENTGGILFWQPNMREGVPSLLLGRPVLVTERVQSLGTNGDIIYGDLKHYFIGDRGPMIVDSSIHNRFETDQVTLRMRKRFDGQPAIAKAFTKLRE